MRRILIIIIIGMAFPNCSEEMVTHCFSGTCYVKATVVDLRTLDGCDFVFELEDGTRLVPERRTYIQAPSKESDPVYHYKFENGARVTIDFEESQVLSACMAGQMVFVTCISNLKNSNP